MEETLKLGVEWEYHDSYLYFGRNMVKRLQCKYILQRKSGRFKTKLLNIVFKLTDPGESDVYLDMKFTRQK